MCILDVLDLLIGEEHRTEMVLQRASKKRVRTTVAAALGRLDLVRKWLPDISKQKHPYEQFSRVFGYLLVKAAAYSIVT